MYSLLVHDSLWPFVRGSRGNLWTAVYLCSTQKCWYDGRLTPKCSHGPVRQLICRLFRRLGPNSPVKGKCNSVLRSIVMRVLLTIVALKWIREYEYVYKYAYSIRDFLSNTFRLNQNALKLPENISYTPGIATIPLLLHIMLYWGTSLRRSEPTPFQVEGLITDSDPKILLINVIIC
jgi:hypothetical protein